MFQFGPTAKTSVSEADGSPRLCHWCNRPINIDELIVAYVPRPHDEAAPVPDAETESLIDEQAWHTVCYGMIQGAPTIIEED